MLLKIVNQIFGEYGAEGREQRADFDIHSFGISLLDLSKRFIYSLLSQSTLKQRAVLYFYNASKSESQSSKAYSFSMKKQCLWYVIQLKNNKHHPLFDGSQILLFLCSPLYKRSSSHFAACN
jgi:hypothetical protein